VMLPMVYGLLVTSRSRLEQRYLLSMGVLFLILLVLTFGRGGWVTLIVMVAVGAPWIGGRRRCWVPAAIGAAVAASALASASGLIHLAEFMGRGQNVRDRIDCARLAWQVFASHPLLGIAPCRWDIRSLAAGHPVYGPGMPLIGLLQIPVSGGLVGITLAAAFTGATGVKLLRIISRSDDPRTRLLVKCGALGLVALIVESCFDITMAMEGVFLAPVLLGVLLGSGRRREATSAVKDSAT
jgi:O-antigen ligase